MNIKEFWKDKKQQRKDNKILKKSQKKSPLTKEQKAYKIFGAVFMIFVICGACMYACRNMSDGDVNWGQILGIDQEVVDIINTPVDENLLFANGKIISSDWHSCINVFDNVGLDIIDKDKFSSTKIGKNFLQQTMTLTSNQLGGLNRQLLQELNNSTISSLMYYDIEKIDGKYIQTTIAYINLSTLITGLDLPNIYLTSISEIKILNNKLTSLNSKIRINMLDDETNQTVITQLENYKVLQLDSLLDKAVIGNFELFAGLIESKISLSDEGMVFVPNKN